MGFRKIGTVFGAFGFLGAMLVVGCSAEDDPSLDRADEGESCAEHVDCSGALLCCDDGTCQDSCVEPATGCGDLTYEGTCNGQQVSWCEDGEVYTNDCASMGMSCGWNELHGFNSCIEPGCGGVTYEGYCTAEGLLVYCEEGQVYNYNCATDGLGCGWDGTNGFYNCTDGSSGGSYDECSYCLDSCKGLPSCCTGTGCICDSAC